ncbi:winged helix-turn-helix domain-containing protein [Pseudoalteromonas peptidolytica]|uniref:OmpR/PhoB-type domain-containing protein n=1 Tax=Pseudoalteromonas peptidolytica F12-50-A1 TaxID=1315280 RepID=A0A8I0T447_9GAMM|nr:winged helix-turn-helix domain-containing protein [Pseudoalteromonas peptidolytica]MBE0345798.1 hypothetical protein [Pseudoalteromonas peptidolytica F12-50-A1]NLR14407.1 hypothetical protein [Pseudoalteromonas peptidolytica]GEK07967.1 hypothetical protein PPE03_02160 [Pseudoalteromonas peptidolytica]
MKDLLLGNWLVMPKLNQIIEYPNGQEYTVTPKMMQLLLVLIEADAQPLSIDEIIELVWKPKVVSDSSVYQAVAQLRKILNSDPQHKEYIERISGHGYRIAPNVLVTQNSINTSVKSSRWIWFASVGFTLALLLAILTSIFNESTRNSAEDDPYFDEVTLAKHLSKSTNIAELEQAKSLYQQVLSKQGENIDALSGLCNAYMGLSLFGEISEYELLALCRPLLEKARGLEEKNIEVITSLARFAVIENNDIQAQKYFTRGFEISIDNPRLWHWYGRFLRKSNDIEGAVVAHQKAYRLAPNDAVIVRGLAYAYLNFRDMSLARKYFERSVAIAPHTKNNPLYQLDFYPLSQKRALQYLQWYRENHVDHNKLYPAQQLSHILMLLSLGRTQEANTLYQQATQFTTTSASFRLYVEAGLAWQQGNAEKAETLLKQRYTLGSNAKHYVMPYVMALIANRKSELAKELFERHFSEVSSLLAPISEHTGQYLIYALMLKLTEQQNKYERVNTLISNHLAQDKVLDTSLLALWFTINNEELRAKQALTDLLNDGWLPDYNDSFFAIELYFSCFADHEFKRQWQRRLKRIQAQLEERVE